MGIATFPSVSSPIKSIQRGSAASAGTVAITAVDVSKSFVNSFSTSSTGTVAASGTLSGANGSTSAPSGATNTAGYTWTSYYRQGSTLTSSVGGSSRYSSGFTGSGNNTSMNINLNAMNVSMNSTNLSGGSTNLVSAVYGAYLTNSTTLTVTGPCRYEVVEYY